jgi:hypothetical protein
MSKDEWRVEIDLDDDEYGYGFGERLRSHDLDDDARERLGGRVVVTRDGPRVFLYAASESEARGAEQVARELVEADELTADIAVTRWHPVEEAWRDAAIPLPDSDAAEEAELDRKEEAEWEEAEEEGSFDWLVKLELPSRADAADWEERLRGESYSVHRRWHYVTVDVVTEERANELGNRLGGELPEGAKVWVEANPDDVPSPVFVLLESKL